MTPETISTRRIKGYTIAEEDGPAELIALVGTLILDGWQPFGSFLTTGDGVFRQAMVRYEQEGQ